MRADNKYQRELQEKKGSIDLKEQVNYRQAIGELIYLYTICRVDISIVIITLSQHVQQPAETHYNAAKHLFIYLNSTRDYGLVY